MFLQSYGGSPAAVKDLEEKINIALNNGGELHGSPFSYIQLGNNTITQAVVFNKDK